MGSTARNTTDNTGAISTFTPRVGSSGGGNTPGVEFAAFFWECATSTGSQTITSTNLNGATPKAALFFGVGQIASQGSTTPQTMARLSVGMTDGDNSNSHTLSSRNAANPSFEFIRGQNASSTAACLTILGFGTTSANEGEAIFESFSTNSVTINWQTPCNSTYTMGCLLFGGNDLSAKAGYSNLGGSTVVSATSPGFEPDLILATYGNDSSVNAGRQNIRFSLGAATANRQRSMALSIVSAQTDPNASMHLDTDACIFSPAYDTATENFSVGVENFNNDGFDFRQNSNSGDDIHWLALRFGQGQAELFDFLSATATGVTQSISGLSFQPEIVFGAMSKLTAQDEGESDERGETLSLFCVSSDEQNCYAYFEQNMGTGIDSATRSVYYNSAIGLIGSTGSGSTGVSFNPQRIRADWDSWASDGVNLNWTSVQSTGRYGWGLALKT